jgi:hypothetical protein
MPLILGTSRFSGAGESTAAERWACTYLFAALIIAEVVVFSFVGHPAPPRSLRAPLRMIAVCWPGNCRSRPLFFDFAEMSTFEQARRLVSHIPSSVVQVNKRIHRSHHFSASSSLVQSDSDSQVQACCIYPLVNRTRDSLHNHRDDGETLAAERIATRPR